MGTGMCKKALIEIFKYIFTFKVNNLGEITS